MANIKKILATLFIASIILPMGAVFAIPSGASTQTQIDALETRINLLEQKNQVLEYKVNTFENNDISTQTRIDQLNKAVGALTTLVEKLQTMIGSCIKIMGQILLNKLI